MSKKEIQLMKDALQKQHKEVAKSPMAARALLNELRLLTKSGTLKKSVSPPTSRGRVSS
jgi:flagellar motor switch protein FliG